MSERLLLGVILLSAASCTTTTPERPPPPPVAPSPSASPIPTTTALPAPAPPTEPEAIEGASRCTITAPRTKALSALGPFVAVHGGESFCAQDTEGVLWCGRADRLDHLFRHPTLQPTSVSVTEGAHCAIDRNGIASCLLDVPVVTATGPGRQCVLTMPNVATIAIHGFDSHLTSALPLTHYLCATSRDGRTACHRSLFTYDATMPLGLTIDEPVAVENLPRADELALPGSCARAEGTVHCWSAPPEVAWAGPQHAPPPGPLQDVPTQPWSPRANVRQLPGRAVSLQSGVEHLCARDDASAVHCWGRNEVRQLGFKMNLPPPSHQDAPALVEHPPRLVKGVGNASAIAVGAFHTCALPASGRHWMCWGLNDAGQLGHERSDCHAAGHAPGLPNRCAGPAPVNALAIPNAIAAQGKATLMLDATGHLSWLPPQSP